MSFKQYKTLDLTEISNKISDYWDKDKTFEKSISSRDNSEDFVFFEGPPSANGMPGIHHVMARAIKDIFCRYKTLKGFKVNRKVELLNKDVFGLTNEFLLAFYVRDVIHDKK